MSIQGKINNSKEKPLLLFSCLDWGLGHTTRSIPLIHEFLKLGCDIIVACNSTQKALLISEFPDLEYVPLKGYNLQYGRKSWSTRLKIVFQLSKILTQINFENQWLNRFLEKNGVDAVVSDNRYGLYNKKVISVFITHQLAVKTGFGALADKISQLFLYRFINRFSECWIPDFPNNTTLAGELSHPKFYPEIPVNYLGALSRFHQCDHQAQVIIDILIILSGPEPQRSILEKTMFQQSFAFNGKIVIVRGLPGSDVQQYENGQALVYNHLNAENLNRLACDSKLVISRSGYTTVMDMIKLKKKLVVIPTPGQPEQEYLGALLEKNLLAACIKQHEFSIQKAMDIASEFPYKQIDDDMNDYKKVLKGLVDKISS